MMKNEELLSLSNGDKLALCTGSPTTLNNHSKGLLYCCKRCLFMTEDTNTIRKHFEICAGKEEFNITVEIKDKRNYDLQETIQKLENALVTEKEKVKLLIKLLNENTNINVNSNNEGTLNIRKRVSGTKKYRIKKSTAVVTPIIDIVHEEKDNSEMSQQLNVVVEEPTLIKSSSRKSRSRTRGIKYRAIKSIELVDEPKQEYWEAQIEDISVHRKEIMNQTFGDINIDKHEDVIKGILQAISSNKDFGTRILPNIAKNRYKLFGQTGLKEYTKKVRSTNNKLQRILAGHKIPAPTIEKYIVKSMHPMEMRLVDYPQYHLTSVEPEDIQKLQICCFYQMINHSKEFVPFSVAYDSIQNYSMAFIPIRKYIQKLLVNPYGFHNIIYVDLPKSTQNDPFSFYRLRKIEDEKRFWELDCRLEYTAMEIQDNLRNWSIQLFRKIYMDVFNDNTFRENFIEYSQITQYECRQLIQNIISLDNLNTLRKNISGIIKEKATYNPTEKDKFNFCVDDTCQKARLKKEEYTDDSRKMLLMELFDNLEEEQEQSCMKCVFNSSESLF